MPGNRKPPKKQYDPTRATRRAVQVQEADARRKALATAMTDEYAAPLEMAVLSGLEEMRKGKATENEWNSVARGINHAWTLADLGIGPEATPVIDAAEAGMRRVGERYLTTQSLTLDAQGLLDVRDALYLWGRQLRMCTVGEVDRASRLVDSKYWEQQA